MAKTENSSIALGRNFLNGRSNYANTSDALSLSTILLGNSLHVAPLDVAYLRNALAETRAFNEPVPADFEGPLLPGRQYSDIPTAPPGIDMNYNLETAKKIWSPWTFKTLVQNRGYWDYKQIERKYDGSGSRYENFGNWHYGAIGAASGLFPLRVLLNEAGRAQKRDSNTNPSWGEPAPFWQMLLLGVDGTRTRGDEPKDAYWIQKGFEWYHSRQQAPTSQPKYSITFGY
jgi:hypothetical protein